MKIISIRSLTKAVIIQGVSFEVPKNSIWAAIDKCGELYAYTTPILTRDEERFMSPYNILEGHFVAEVSDFGDWKETLTEIK